MAKQTNTAAKAAEQAVPRVRRPAARRELLIPQYRVTQLSYIDNVLCGPGTKNEVVTYYGVPGQYLVPVNAAAKANKQAAVEVRNENKGDPTAIADALRSLDDDLQGVEKKDDEAALYEDSPLSDAERAQLQKHADQTQKDQELQDDLGGVDRTGVVLTGNPQDPEGKGAADAARAEQAAGKK